jgi:hypothetical protein
VSEDVSPGGSEILRHEAGEHDFEPSAGDAVLIEAIDAHLTTAFGDDEGLVFHEVVSDLVHVDVHVAPPARERTWTTLVTSGMAERPMAVPEAIEDYRYAELVLAVPGELKTDAWALPDGDGYWPVRVLNGLARLPHDFETFLYYGHTIPNGDPPEPYTEGTSLCCALIDVPQLTDPAFDELQLEDGRLVRFYGVYALHRNEMEFKLQAGTDALRERLAEAGVTELIDLDRESVIGRRRRLLGRGR